MKRYLRYFALLSALISVPAVSDSAAAACNCGDKCPCGEDCDCDGCDH